MDEPLRKALENELRAAAAARDYPELLHHLSRAHILSQRHTWRHVHVHLLILKAGFAARDVREVVGQTTRMIAAALFSRIWVPIGNTGLANVSAMRPMPIPDDLKAYLEIKRGTSTR